MTKLSITQKPDQPVTMILPSGEEIRVTIKKASPSRIKILVEAPPTVRILRRVDYSQQPE